MGHLIQILILVAINGVFVRSWSIFFMMAGVEIVSVWRHQIQHHPETKLASPIWFVGGIVVMVSGALFYRFG